MSPLVSKFIFLLITPLAAAVTRREDFRHTEKIYRWTQSPVRTVVLG